MKHFCTRRLTALLLAVIMCISMVPSAFAAQEDAYHDPAEHWISTMNRTSELDSNAVVTRETFYCGVCDFSTSFTIFRTAEYTRDGVTALSRNVKYSDGTMTDEVTIGNILDGTPGVDATYTGYHWTKAVCDTCGTTNSNAGGYSMGKNLYYLYDCAAEFMHDLDETVSYEYADSTYHKKITKGGSYCIFCYGTHHTDSTKLERHDLETTVTPQLAHQRFVVKESCALCDYEETSYVLAKSVIADYYGTVDGKPHTLTVTDLSESGVYTKIRYGNSADTCTLTSAPNYTEEGKYTVYYEITYTYKSTEMVENGVAYVWLSDETAPVTEDEACGCGCGDKNCGCTLKTCSGASCCADSDVCGDNHSFVLLDSVDATCLTLGYDRHFCIECGKIEKRDYENALGHAWQGVTVREATCETDGKVMEICANCGQVKTETTPKGEHEYKTYSVEATCTSPGYQVKECSVCGERSIADITSVKNHSYIAYVTPATCDAGGLTLYRCDGCGSSHVSGYTAALEHKWNGGRTVTEPTCTGEGVTEYKCTYCGASRLETVPATGHTVEGEANCTDPQLCVTCGAVTEKALKHDYKAVVTAPTCTAMGYTTFTCESCNDSYKGEYTDALGHKHIAKVTAPTCLDEGFTTYTCEACGDSYIADRTDALGHEWDEGIRLTDSTCGGEGIIEYNCIRCEEHRHEVLSADGHNPGEPATCTQPQLCTDCGAVIVRATGHSYEETVTPATCVAMGYTTYTCADCGKSYKSDYTDPLGHNHIGVVTEPTCLDEGFTTYTCGRCADSYVSDRTEPLGHEWNEGRKMTDATCGGDGVMEYRCVRCDYHRLEVLSAVGHTPGEPATCTQPQLCTKCGAVIERATGHNYEAVVTPATCVAMGYTTYTCADCDKSYKSDYTDALGHDHIVTITEPTCYEDGFTTHKCSRCEDTFITDPTDALGHEWDEGRLVNSSTCNAEGLIDYRCIRCDYHHLEAKSAEGHTPGKAATCTEPQTCVDCGAFIANALGHKYESEVTAPTCTEMGYTTYTCTGCDESYKGEYTNPIGHKESEWIIDREPTTEKEGLKHKECENCGIKLESETIRKLYMTATTDTYGEAVVGGYLVIVTDTDTRNPVANATVTLNEDKTVSVRLPNSRVIDYDDQTTVTVLLSEDKAPVSGMKVSVTDKYDNYCAEKTNASGKITVPDGDGSTNSDGKTTIGFENADGDRFTLTVKVEDYETGRPIRNADVTIGKTGNITVVLPDGIDMDKNNRITVTVTDNRENPVEDQPVIVKNDLGKKEKGETDEDGKLTVPEIEIDAKTEYHGVYIVGYEDGTFGAERSMTRSEAAAIFARLLAEKKDEHINPYGKTEFDDVPIDAWYAGYVRYLTGYGIVFGFSDNTFRPDVEITRAEFTVMAVRFFEAYGDGAPEIMEQYAKFDDVVEGYWAASYISDAAKYGWIKGYGDGTFRADSTITRAEVVTLVNRLLGRTPDKEYIDDNYRYLNSFTDIGKRHWAYYEVMEAANGHTAVYDKEELWER